MAEACHSLAPEVTHFGFIISPTAKTVIILILCIINTIGIRGQGDSSREAERQREGGRENVCEREREIGRDIEARQGQRER